MRNYDLVCLIKSNINNAEVEDLVSKIKDLLFKNEMKVVKYENWGLRSLEYKIQKYKKAYYIYMYISGEPKNIYNIKKEMSFFEDLLRFIFIKNKYSIEDSYNFLTSNKLNESIESSELKG